MKMSDSDKKKTSTNSAKTIRTMPSPPAFLVKEDIDWHEADPVDVLRAQEDLDQWTPKTESMLLAEPKVGRNEDPSAEAARESQWSQFVTKIEDTTKAIPDSFAIDVPSSGMSRGPIDYLAYQQAIEDRVSAEKNYAEIYTKHSELLSFNEKTLRTLRRYYHFKERVRAVYNRALRGDDTLLHEARKAKKELAETEKVVSQLQIENEALRVSLSSHEAGYKDVASKLGQFQEMSQEYENRGIIIREADHKIRTFLEQIDNLETTLKEKEDRFEAANEQALQSYNKMRECEIRETGLAALNEELADALTKCQKQVHNLETEIQIQGEAAKRRIETLEAELTRLRDNQRAGELLGQSKELTETIMKPAPIASESAALQPAGKKESPHLATVPKNKKQWDDFYDRWSGIIDGLSSHSVPLNRSTPLTAKENSDIQLVSEIGDIEII